MIDDFASEIKIQASRSGAPETMKKYKVTGYLNQINNEYVIQEISRESLEKKSETPQAYQQTEAEKEKLRLQQQQFEAEQERQKRNQTMLYVIIGVAAVLIVVVVIIFATKRKSGPTSFQPQIDHDTGPKTQPGTIRNTPPETVGIKPIASEGFKTIRFENPPKTMKFIPGKFTITSQEDKGKSFKIAGYPSHGDAVITIGREEVRGERSYAHIRIDDKFQTVSRKQAELVYSNGTLYAINRSESNYTQVDGYELKPGEKKEVKNGSLLRMGELEMQYEI